jgi:6-phosphogluconolactonase (cycloisomerase 2 family)
VVIAPSGGYLYVASYDSDSVWAYTIDRVSGALRPLLKQPFAAGKSPRGLAIDRRGRFLYCTNYGSNSVSAYRIDPATGALNAIPGSPYSAGDGPFGIAVF